MTKIVLTGYGQWLTSKVEKECAVTEKKFVPEQLRKAAEIYEERNKLYGDNYKLFGLWTCLLFPNDVKLETTDDYTRFGVLTQILSKVSRYCQNFDKGGHDDSLDDLVVYAMMLKELDSELPK